MASNSPPFPPPRITSTESIVHTHTLSLVASKSRNALSLSPLSPSLSLSLSLFKTSLSSHTQHTTHNSLHTTHAHHSFQNFPLFSHTTHNTQLPSHHTRAPLPPTQTRTIPQRINLTHRASERESRAPSLC